MLVVPVSEIHKFLPENYSDYYPGKEKVYDLPTKKSEDRVLSNDELFAKILREYMTI